MKQSNKTQEALKDKYRDFFISINNSHKIPDTVYSLIKASNMAGFNPKEQQEFIDAAFIFIEIYRVKGGYSFVCDDLIKKLYKGVNE